MKSLLAAGFSTYYVSRDVSVWEKYETLWTLLIIFGSLIILALLYYFIIKAENGAKLTVLLQYCYGGKTEKLSVKKGGTVPAPFPEREGFRFCGWYTDSAFTRLFDGEPAKHDMTLYAKWEKVAE